MSPQVRGYAQSWKTPARYASLSGMLTALLLVGCAKSGSELALVSGRVTLDAQPIVGARLRFQPEASGGSPSYGSTDRDGRYELGYKRDQKGALIGWHAIRIELGADRAGAGSKNSPPRVLPARYNVKTELRRAVKADENNEFNFELTSDEKQ